jgi:pyrimidine operon attenuation protein/uracil phosphoribosyltransferase
MNYLFKIIEKEKSIKSKKILICTDIVLLIASISVIIASNWANIDRIVVGGFVSNSIWLAFRIAENIHKLINYKRRLKYYMELKAIQEKHEENSHKDEYNLHNSYACKQADVQNCH